MSDIQNVQADLGLIAHEGGVITDGTARTIAAGWHGGGADCLTALSHTGAIAKGGLLVEIDTALDYVRANPQAWDAPGEPDDLGTQEHNIAALEALAAYVSHHGDRGEQSGWSNIWAGRG